MYVFLSIKRVLKKQKEAVKVGIVMGSDSDLDIMQEAAVILKNFQIPYEMTVASAHRSPKRAGNFAATALKRGMKVIIAGAGHAAHLAGVLAAHTPLPVIGVPIDSSCLQGLDALLATVQMPPGIPVATMAIGKSGAREQLVELGLLDLDVGLGGFGHERLVRCAGLAGAIIEAVVDAHVEQLVGLDQVVGEVVLGADRVDAHRVVVEAIGDQAQRLAGRNLDDAERVVHVERRFGRRGRRRDRRRGRRGDGRLRGEDACTRPRRILRLDRSSRS